MRPVRPTGHARPFHLTARATGLVLVMALALAACSDSKDDNAGGDDEHHRGGHRHHRAPGRHQFHRPEQRRVLHSSSPRSPPARRTSPRRRPPTTSRPASRRRSAAIDKAVAVAPAEIKGDVSAIAAAFQTVVAELWLMPDTTSARSTPRCCRRSSHQASSTAVTRLQAYLTNVCKAPPG